MVSLPPEQSLGYQIRIIHRAFDRLLVGRLAEYGLKSGYWYYLRVLWLREGLTQRELSDAINVKENTTVALILGMEKDGLIVRKQDKRDRRKQCIYLTERARKLEAKLLPISIEVNDAATAGVSKRDLDTCFSVLEKVHINLKTLDP